jgi:hypothetical protein
LEWHGFTSSGVRAVGIILAPLKTSIAVSPNTSEAKSATRRFGQPLELIAAREMPDIHSARILERKLKAKKSPQVAIYLLKNCPDR